MSKGLGVGSLYLELRTTLIDLQERISGEKLIELFGGDTDLKERFIINQTLSVDLALPQYGCFGPNVREGDVLDLVLLPFHERATYLEVMPLYSHHSCGLYKGPVSDDGDQARLTVRSILVGEVLQRRVSIVARRLETIQFVYMIFMEGGTDKLETVYKWDRGAGSHYVR